MTIGFLAMLSACGGGGESVSREVEPTATEDSCTVANGCITAGDEIIVLAAGDIASCDSDGDEATAELLDSYAGTVLALGDNVYDNGTLDEFEECYDPSWGRHFRRTKPVLGNHEYQTDGAEGYFQYFGEAAGTPGEGWYSFDVGAWHMIALNSNCDEIGGCDEGSPQEQWLRADLAANRVPCTLAFWHDPRFSSGSENGDNPEMEPIWQALDDAAADLVVVAHEHNYERFAPQTAWGDADPDGIVQIVVGTGGKARYGFDEPQPNSLVRNDDTFGVLKLTLHDRSYDFEFIPEPGSDFTDAGSFDCH